MNWIDKLKDYAPSIASAVMSGGATLPQLAYKAIADVSGMEVNSETQAALAIETASPSEMLALKQADYSFKVEMEKLQVESQRIVNSTMQVEAKSDDWWVSGWRPYIGYITGTAFFVVCVFVCVITYKAVMQSLDPMAMIPQIIFNFSTLFAIPGAILGVASHHRGKMQREEAAIKQT